MKNFSFFICMILILCSFCKKEPQNTGGVAEILTNGAWTQTQSLTDSNGDGIFTDISLNCEMDNTWVFAADSTLAINDLGEYCIPDLGPITLAGYWALSNNDEHLHILLAQGFTQEEYKIATITETELELQFIDPANPNGPVKKKVLLNR